MSKKNKNLSGNMRTLRYIRPSRGEYLAFLAPVVVMLMFWFFGMALLATLEFILSVAVLRILMTARLLGVASFKKQTLDKDFVMEYRRKATHLSSVWLLLVGAWKFDSAVSAPETSSLGAFYLQAFTLVVVALVVWHGERSATPLTTPYSWVSRQF